MGEQLKTFNLQGYLKIHLVDENGKSHRYFLHRLLAKAFIPNPNNYPCVNHKNGVKQDLSLDNLEWCSIKHNNDHAIRTGLHPEVDFIPVLTDELVKEAREFYHVKGMSCLKISRMFGIARTALGPAINGKSWKHVPMPPTLRTSNKKE